MVIAEALATGEATDESVSRAGRQAILLAVTLKVARADGGDVDYGYGR